MFASNQRPEKSVAMASLLGMHDPDVPDTVDETVGGEAAQPEAAQPEATAPAKSDEVLDGFEADLDNVSAALDALDADDLDGAETLVNGLTEPETPVDDGEPA